MLPFLPQKACMGRKCCQQRGLLRAFGEKGTHTARFLPDGPQVRRNARKGCEVYGAARWVTPLGRATRQAAAPTGWAGGRDGAKTRRWWDRGRHDAGGNGGVGTQRWRDRRRSQAGTSSPRREPGSAGGHGGTGATLADARRGGRWDAALGLTARRARWKRVTVGREGSGLTRRNTPTRVAAIRPNWRALPQRALRALR